MIIFVRKHFDFKQSTNDYKDLENMNTILEVPEIQVEDEEYDSIRRLDSLELSRRNSMQLSTTSRSSNSSLWHGRRRSRSARLARVWLNFF